MMSPGGGAGLKADARTKIQVAHQALLLATNAFEMGSKEQQALLRAVTALNVFGKTEGTSMVPAGIAAMAQASKRGPPVGAPPPGVAGGMGPPGPPPMPPPEAMGEAA
jgi:hypothetical protein